MHYVGMAAVRAPADDIWDFRYVVASVVIGISFMALAMPIALRRNTFRGYAEAAGLFTVAICSMHFTAMTAVTFKFEPLVAIPN